MRSLGEVMYELAAAGTSGQVAEKLFRAGIRGDAGECSTCPVAEYVKQETNSNYVRVDAEYVEADDESHDTPDVVVDFIEAFDGGDYPELDRAHEMEN